MRILLIHNYLTDRGGEDVMFDSTVKLLTQKKHEVYTYTKKSIDIREDKISQLKASVNMFLGQAVRKELAPIINSFKPHIAHISNIFPLITPIIFPILKSFDMPVVQSIHSHRLLCPKSTFFRNGKVCTLCLNKKFAYPSILYSCYHNSRPASLFLSSSMYYHQIRDKLNLIDKFVFPSKFTRNLHIKYLPIPLQKTVVIPNFVEEVKVTNNNTTKRDYFLFVGRLSEEKNIIPLLEIFSHLPELNLVVIGSGPLEKQVNAFKKFKNILIKGHIATKDLHHYYKHALCTIIPSAPLYEFGPLVLMESFSHGTPVLVPKSGVFLERVEEGRTGYFYRPDFLDGFSSKLLFISNNIPAIRLLRLNAKKEYKENYTSSIFYQRLLHVYTQVL